MTKRVHNQKDAYTSPWGIRTRLVLLLWRIVRLILFRPTPKVCYPWRVFLLRLFGAKVRGRPFVDATCRIWLPSNLAMADRACLGARVDVYNLAPVTLNERCTVAQDAALCTGTHDFADSDLPLVTAPVRIGADAFVGMRAIILPGVSVGQRCVVGAGSVVTRDLPEGKICAGNPAKVIRDRDA